ncbi:zinc finger protein 462 isoform X2 [Trichomycterus rosablanca]
MEGQQCDGCDFRANSHDELKLHIQDVHTVFLQPADVGTESPQRSQSLTSLSHAEEEEDGPGTKKCKATKGCNSFSSNSPRFSSSGQTVHSPRSNQSVKSSTPFFQCRYCVRYFRSKALLDDHTRKLHSVSVDGVPNSFNASRVNIAVRNAVDKMYSCQYCSYKSPRRGRLLKHQRSHHKDSFPTQSGPLVDPGTEVLNASAAALSPVGLPELMDRKVLESMVTPRHRGGFSCEWCGFQTLQRQQLCDHMVKKHRNMVKIMVSLQKPKADGSGGSSKSDSQRSTPTSSLVATDLSGNEGSSRKGTSVRSTSGSSSFQYSHVTGKIPNSTGTSLLSKRFLSDSSLGFDSSVNNSRSSSDGELCDTEDLTYSDQLAGDDSSKLLLTEEDNKLLEVEGIPIRKHLNMFQCPFCSFLAKHRRSVSRHIENVHLSSKTTLCKCNECPFVCTSPTKLANHKQSHRGSSSELEVMDLTSEGPDGHVEDSAELMINGKKPFVADEEQNVHHCSMCNFTSTSLKGLRVHQQNKHSYCDGMQATGQDDSLNGQQDSESEAYNLSTFVQKTQTSILGLSSRKHLISKTARKSINDLPLDLSPLKKRTRIDEIASNLQSKISQSQQHDDVINLEDMDYEDDENENDMETSAENSEIQSQRFTYNTQHLYIRKHGSVQAGVAKRKRSLQTSRNVSVPLTVFDDEDNFDGSLEPKDQSNQDMDEVYQENMDYSAEPGSLFYCKHCEYQNKSARSVSTHYQRMHPYIKFSFKYILDPEDQSAVFRCLECFVEYNNFSDLHQHYMDHHPEASNVLNFNQPDLVYTCRFCSYTSPNVRSLMPHYQRMHPSVKINNAMIFSSYVVDQPQKEITESQTLREILNSGPKSFSVSRSSSNPALKNLCRTPESSLDSESFKEALDGNVVVYDCDVCSFASPNMHSVLVHYQKKHPEQKASYFRIQKTMRVVSADRVNLSTSSTYSLSSTPKSAGTALHLPLNDEVYYCKHCVYSNRSVVGVLVHYQKRHPEIKVTAKYIKHAPPTPGLMKLMEELQIAPPKQFLKQFSNNATDGSSNSYPKGIVDKNHGEMLYFCQHCDYGNRTVKGVLIHYQKKHKEAKANADLVRRHTAVVRSQRERAQMTQTGSSTSTATSATDAETPRPLRALKCRHCVFTSPYVYALKKHLKKDHPTVKATAMTILRWAYQDGILEAGYHCEWCIYFHAEPSGLLMHYQRRHPEHNVDYAYMASKLWAGPDTSTSSSSRQAGNSEIKHYQCRDCAFEACSVWDITNHYQAVHPWAIKDDESVLISIIKGNRAAEKSVEKGCASTPSLFNSYQSDESLVEITRPAPEHHPHLSFPGSSSISNNAYQCTVCLSEYNSLHGLLTHYGKKHPGMKVKAADFAQDADINPSSVYKCRHCPYVNSRIHGVLTHYQKRHPLVKVTAEDFADDIEVQDQAADADERSKTQRQGYGAYRCKLCAYSHGTFEKLKIHYEKYHNQSVLDILASTHELSPVMKENSYTEPGVISVSDVAEVRKFDVDLSEYTKREKHTLFKCQLCKYFCSTRKGIARHYRIKHNNVRAQPEGKNNVFKCALCNYTNPIRKGLAAHYQKRHDIDAYYTHCLAASKTFNDKPSKVTLPLVSEENGPVMSAELKQSIEQRKCSLCSFQAFSRKSIISHYVKRHPGVFPKKQPSSKLGRYFTVIYPKEAEMPAVVQNDEPVEVPSVDRRETEWLPLKCMMCSEFTFTTADQLVTHYNNVHSSELRRDFVTIQSPVETDTELYQCTHCEIKFLTLPELSNHLFQHNEDFEKWAVQRGWRRKVYSRQDITPENKMKGSTDKTPIGYRCNFCDELHPTLRAICNHLRKHVQYKENKKACVKGQEVVEVPGNVITNGSVEETVITDTVTTETGGPTEDSASATRVPGVLSTDETAEDVRLAQHQCNMCDRVFMSMQGLRSHERSHFAAAYISKQDKYSCQYCQFQSAFRHNLDRHVQSHHGQHKPFRCKLCPFKSSYLSRLKSHLHKSHAGENTYKCISCSFSTMTISQLKEHSLREHGETLTLTRLRAGTTLRSTHSTNHHALTHPASHISTQQTTDTSGTHGEYLEPPDVQQQLNHYQLASRNLAPPALHSGSPDPSAPGETEPLGGALPRLDSALICEFCEFTSGYMQSLRRHYRDRHGGKKLFKCKDCSFFTCYKSTFTLHVETGHGGPSEPEPVRDLRCPFCLYHTKSKSHMIDHVLLHREERVIPLEVSRSKLSRHLDGLIFRCHKCTFTCSSSENLQQHVSKHEEPKPYECCLCYYDSKHQQQLEEHLRHEHKVIRNFELMGRVNLDQLDALNEKSLSEEEEEDLGEDEEEQEETVDIKEEEEPEEPGGEEEKEELQEEVMETQEEKKQEVELGAESAGAVMEVSQSPEKRFPCEFCGRTFFVSLEWERHVLRHGM